MKSDNFVVIQGWMITELKLSGNDLLVYAIIYQFSQDNETKFSGSLQYLADWCNATKQGIQKNLKNLLDRNLIVKEDTIINGVKFVAYYTTKLHTIQLSCTNNIANISNSNNQQELFRDNTNISNKEDTYREKVQNFVDKFNEICVSLPRCMRLTPKRSKAIVSILKKFSELEIMEVFQKLEASDFCSGRSGKWRANIDFILSENNFVKTLEGKYDNRTPRCNVETISSGNKRQLTQEEKERIRKNGTKF